MNFADLLFIFKWWFTLFLIGLVFLPLTTSIFSNFFDKGYIFSKTLGITIVSYLIFILGIFHFLHFTQINIILSLIFFAAVNIVFNLPFIMQTLKEKWKIFIFEEVIFLLAILFWSYIRSFQPEIHGLEKYMDFGFVNSILRSDYFPPRDMWFTPFYINYYYFGHLITAVLTKLSDIPSSITYNLMLSTIFAMTFIGSFSIGANLLWSNVILKPGRLKDLKGVLRFAQNDRTRIFIGGFLTAFLVSFSGNLHTIYSFFQAYPNENPVPLWQLAFSPDKFPNSYWYPNATRFIYNTIHEFPIYSFVVSDLHGHVLDIPVVLLTIAILLSLIFNFKNKNSFQISNFKLKIILLSFLLAVMYMTNVWDGIIYFLLTIIVFSYLTFRNFPLRREASKLKIFYPWLFKIFILGIAFIIFTLPFNHNFKPFVSGIGILCAPSFLTDIGKVGPFLFEPNHCQKSPLWQLATLYGFFYFWVISFLFLILKKINPKHEAQNPKQGKRFGHLIFKNLNLFRIS
ncbi:MAG: DUF2298 domain-containing protein, partial [Candidatus Levybacteria bacterium]|nr:DUF2298 domain-containing protein [Candidatus Levybacteria bacterium]